MMQNCFHDPVLSAEVIAFLVQKPGIYVDGTVGGGGHSLALLRALHEAGYGSQSLLIGIDQDDAALKRAAETLSAYTAGSVLVKGNFRDIGAIVTRVCSEKSVTPGVTGILLDLGVSSFQIDTPERGFSYLRAGPLDMRMDGSALLSAADIVNSYEEKEIARIVYRYGEEPGSRTIARAIVAWRQQHGSVKNTLELADIIRHSIHGGQKAVKTLSRVFQALRIEVNSELDALRQALAEGIECLGDNGRLAVISYHSLEDRIVKTLFAEKAKSDWGPKGVALREPLAHGTVAQVTRKPVMAGTGEIERNARARSAKLRVIEKISEGKSSL